MTASSPVITPVSDNVDVIQLAGKTIHLVGTAHVSRKSADLVESTIRTVRPDAVAVELCAARHESIRDPDRWKKTDIVRVIREGRAYVLMAQLILAAFQRKIGRELDVKPGEEMIRALGAAEEVGAHVILADRDIRTTLKRTWSTIGFRSLMTICASALGGLFGNEKIDAAEVERLKSTDALEEVMKDFTATLPAVRVALIDERDQYLANSIAGAAGNTIVAVVGAGHVPGIKRWIGQTIDRAKLDEVPPPPLSRQIIGWSIPTVLVALIVYGFISAGSGTSIDMLEAWAWTTSIWAALGAVVALAHPLTIVATFLVAPFAAANPFIASGWIAGLVEAMIRKPTVGDFDSIGDDLTSIRGVWRNRVSRILLVMITTNLLGSLGTILGLSKLWSIAQ
jgi:pheromone shutdown-related protein TraB